MKLYKLKSEFIGFTKINFTNKKKKNCTIESDIL